MISAYVSLNKFLPFRSLQNNCPFALNFYTDNCPYHAVSHLISCCQSLFAVISMADLGLKWGWLMPIALFIPRRAEENWKWSVWVLDLYPFVYLFVYAQRVYFQVQSTWGSGDQYLQTHQDAILPVRKPPGESQRSLGMVRYQERKSWLSWSKHERS